jgi:PAS domain S-box-containing protein
MEAPVALSDLSATALLGDFPEAGLIMAPDGDILFANSAALALFELDEKFTKVNITSFLPENERTRLDPLTWMRRWAERPDAPELAHVHLQCRTTSGREIPVRVRVGRIRSGDDIYYVVMLSDVSEALERQYKTRQQHRLAARVLAISADAIITADRSLQVTYANPSAENLFGYPGGTLIGRPLSDLLPPEFRPGHEAHIRNFEKESAPARLMGERSEVSGLTASGEVIPLEAAITKVTLDREIVFSAHLRDLRVRNAQAQQLSRTLAELTTVFDQALQAMALIDTNGKVAQINRAARALLPEGINAVGKDFASLPFWSADPATTRQTLADAMADCQAGNLVRMPASITLPDGETRQLDFSLSPIVDAGTTFAMLAEARTLLGEDTLSSA